MQPSSRRSAQPRPRRRSFTRELAALHRATTTRAFCAATFSLLRAAVPSSFSTVLLHMIAPQAATVVDSRGKITTPEELQRFFADHPGTAVLAANPGIKILPTRGILPENEEELQKLPFYHNNMVPLKWRHSVALIFWLPDHGVEWRQRLLKKRTSALPEETELQHPKQPGATATITMLPPRADTIGEPCFLVRFRGPVAENAQSGGASPEVLLASLRPRERAVVSLACSGYSNQEIADELGKALGTVKVDLHSGYRALGIKNRVQLLRMFSSAAPAGAPDLMQAIA